MAFESLTEKLQNVFKKLRSKGVLTEADVKSALREVRMALLEADVNFRVVKTFTKRVEEAAIGQDVMKGLNPGQMVIKIVQEELVRMMGSEKTNLSLRPGNEITILMMVGLQGAGKTTAAAKLANLLKGEGRKPLLVACDIYRPAAVQQLRINGEKIGVPVFSLGTDTPPLKIALEAVEYAKREKLNTVILDTAGRLHIDDAMMEELIGIKEALPIDQTIFVADAMTGQDAVNAASTFHDRIGADAAILTKLDSDTRGGAALSIREVTGVPILYVGMGEKLQDLQPFYPDRMASRILGMGDILSLIEKAEGQLNEEKAKELEQKMRTQSFNFNDYLEQMEQVKKMGGLSELLNLLPGMGLGKANMKLGDVDDSQLGRVEAMIQSMTKKERENPDLLNPSRKARIARGAGVEIADVNRLVKQFEQGRKMMKQFSGLTGKAKKGKLRFPF